MASRLRTGRTCRSARRWWRRCGGRGCRCDNADTVEGNKFLDNTRAGIEVLGGSKPTLAKNVFVRNPVAVEIGKINGRPEVGEPTLEGNTFWQNKANLKREEAEVPLP